MMRTRLSMFSKGKLRCRFAEACFSGLVPGRYFMNHLKTFISLAVTRVRRNQGSSSYFLSKMKEHRFSLPFTRFGREQCISPMKSFCLMQYSTLTRVATVSVPIVAETCARRGAGFSRFLQLVPGEGESQTLGNSACCIFVKETNYQGDNSYETDMARPFRISHRGGRGQDF